MEQYNRFELSRSVWKTEMLPLHQYCICMVRDKRLELLRLATRGPKPRLYANSSNPGYVFAEMDNFRFGPAGRTRTGTVLLPRDFLTTLCCHSLNNFILAARLLGNPNFSHLSNAIACCTNKLLSCSLDYVFTISCDLGGWCIVSTHLGFSPLSTALSHKDFHRLANIHSKGFPIRCSFSNVLYRIYLLKPKPSHNFHRMVLNQVALVLHELKNFPSKQPQILLLFCAVFLQL